MTIATYIHNFVVAKIRNEDGLPVVNLESANGGSASLFFNSEVEMVNMAVQLIDAAHHVVTTRTLLQIQDDIADAEKKRIASLAEWERELLGLKNPE